MFSIFLLKNSVLSSEKYFPPLVVRNCLTEGFVSANGILQKYDFWTVGRILLNINSSLRLLKLVFKKVQFHSKLKLEFSAEILKIIQRQEEILPA